MENEKLVDTLNDLVRINRDRVKGYENALEDLKDEDYNEYSSMFMERIGESKKFVAQLSAEIIRTGGEPDDNSTTSGSLYRMWMDLKTTFTGGNGKSVLELCEFGEDAALKAYDKALETDMEWSAEALTLLNEQRMTLQNAHDTVKAQRDAARA